MNTLKWLKELALAPGVSGFESAVKKLLSKNLADICDEDHDGIGSIIFSLKGKEEGPKVMIAAHMDEVGFMVKHIILEVYMYRWLVGSSSSWSACDCIDEEWRSARLDRQ